MDGLLTRLPKLPLVLAGPILRQVTKDAVSVWVALQQSATVTLTVYDSDQPLRSTLMTANRPTTQVGKNLHIVAVTARKTGALSENNIYFYDLAFASPLRTWTLSTAVTRPIATPVQNPFAYPPFTLPSFVLPPKDLTKVRLIHGSCRKPHGQGPDALAILDGLIKQSLSAPLDRPHQLLLTGDQIYADDVADSLLLLLTDAGEALLGWTELLPVANGSSPQAATALPPYVREQPLKDAGFTSDDLRSHLMSLGEFFAMYLFVWSDVLWPDIATPLARFDEILAVSVPGFDLTAYLNYIDSQQGTGQGSRAPMPPPVVAPKIAQIMLDRQKTIEADTTNVETFRKTLPAIRAVLANIPSYMICDDHEVTDDWNMTRRFCRDVYGGQLGMRVVQNALIGFSVCQAWGNVPEQFAQDAQNPPGLQLLQTLTTVNSQTKDLAPAVYASQFAIFMKLVGLHFDSEIVAQKKGDYGTYHEPGKPIQINGVPLNDTSLRYNFSIEGDSYQVIVTDSRTWRSFPDAGLDKHPELIPGSALDSQLETDVPALGNRLLLLVFTTNIPVISSVRVVEGIGTKSLVYEHDLYDSWQFPSDIFDRMIVRLSKKVAKAGRPKGPVVFLSGDVHFAFSSRLAYWAEKAQLGDPQGPGQGTKTSLVFAQLVASSLKNEIEDTRGMQNVGYRYHPSWWQRWVVPAHEPESYVGWNITQGQQIGTGMDPDGNDVPLFVDAKNPTLSNSDFAPFYLSNSLNIRKPDYRYRLDYLVPTQSGQVAPTPPAIPQLDGTNPTSVAQASSKASTAYLNLINKGGKNPDCVGHNNLGEIRLNWDTTKGIVDHVYHTLRWQQPDSATPANLLVFAATYDVATDIGDVSFYKPILADQEV